MVLDVFSHPFQKTSFLIYLVFVFLFFSFSFFFFFKWPRPWHTEVPGLGTESKLQLRLTHCTTVETPAFFLYKIIFSSFC